MDWRSIVAGFANRFKEPSSWAGLSVILTLAGLKVSGVEVGYIVDIGVGVCGLIAFFVPEKAK